MILLGISGVLACTFLILIYFAILNDSEELEITSYAFAAAAFLIVIVLTMNECLRLSDNKFISFNLMVKRALDEHFSKVN